MSTVVIMIRGALAASSVVAGVFFLRFWRTSGDRLFAYFAAAFFTLTLDWTALGFSDRLGSSKPYVYLLRLFAFSLMIAGIIDKNRRNARSR